MRKASNHRFPKTRKRRVKNSLESTQNQSLFQNKNFDIAILITLLPAISYAIIYLYKLSKYSYYRIPIDLIDINLKNVAWILLTVVVISLLLYTITDTMRSNKFFMSYFSNKSIRLKVNLFLILLAGFLLLFQIMDANNVKLFNKNIKTPPKLSYLVLTIAYIQMFITSIVMIKKRKEENKLFRTSTIIAYGGGFIISLLSFPFFLGYFSSVYSSSHYMILDDSPTVVLDTYKDKFIVAPIDLNKKVITPRFSFIKIETDKDGKGQIESIRTGRLTVKEPSTIKELTNHK
ncbi:hypothetical protein [Priestia megaterium]|uniref:hypothetical protein n=1 Tax=Priestia megaterium TaxID=1404 RepID=UPI002E241F19|nr:hypothetical protein [Priestia megaterium]